MAVVHSHYKDVKNEMIKMQKWTAQYKNKDTKVFVIIMNLFIVE